MVLQELTHISARQSPDSALGSGCSTSNNNSGDAITDDSSELFALILIFRCFPKFLESYWFFKFLFIDPMWKFLLLCIIAWCAILFQGVKTLRICPSRFGFPFVSVFDGEKRGRLLGGRRGLLLAPPVCSRWPAAIVVGRPSFATVVLRCVVFG